MLKSSIQVESEGWYWVLESSQKIDIETRLDDQSSYEEVQEEQHCILYYDIIETLQFLLSHSSFQDKLIYALVWHCNVNNFQVYDKMHTADWWWETQKKLSDYVIMISLLIFIDKTVLIEHWNNLSA